MQAGQPDTDGLWLPDNSLDVAAVLVRVKGAKDVRAASKIKIKKSPDGLGSVTGACAERFGQYREHGVRGKAKKTLQTPQQLQIFWECIKPHARHDDLYEALKERLEVSKDLHACMDRVGWYQVCPCAAMLSLLIAYHAFN